MIFKRAFLLVYLLTAISFQIFGLNNSYQNELGSISADNIYENSKQFNTQADSIAPDNTDMRDITSVQLAKEMVPGWNLGNTLEPPDGEGTWNNPIATQLLIDTIKAAGFNSVRIPVAWSKFTDTTNFIIDEAWLNRVEEVVNYVLNNGMYAIINEHWDNGWIVPTYAQQNEVNKRLEAMWKQIAVHFRDYDDHLLFAGTNEVHVGYNTPTKEYYTVQNSYNQTFVKAVRSTGGRNHYRHLLVQGYNTNINHTINYFVIPQDIITNKLIVEVHYYDPYQFTLNPDTVITQWGKLVTDSRKAVTYANEAYADNQFKKMKTKFIDKGYAVVLGEYGAIAKTELGSDEKNAKHVENRKYYIEYITGSIVRNGLVPFYWDNGAWGNYGFGLFNRTTCAQVYPDIIKAIVDAAAANVSVKEDKEIHSDFLLMQNYPNPFNPETTISYSLPQSGNVSLKIFDVLGREVMSVVDNELKNEGVHKQTINASSLSSGVYFYSLTAGGFTDTKKMIVLK